jgi:hypothetical protein
VAFIERGRGKFCSSDSSNQRSWTDIEEWEVAMKRLATANLLRVTATLALLGSFVGVASPSGAATNDVPVVYGSVEIMVPAHWVVFDGDESGCAPNQIMVLANGAQEKCQGSPEPRGVVTFGRSTLSLEMAGRTRVHGLSVRTGDLEGGCGGRVFIVTKFDAQLLVCGAANSDRTIEDSIRVAPRVAVTAKGPLLRTPSTWRWSTHDGLRFATPATWPVDRPVDIGCPWFGAYQSTSKLELVKPGDEDASCPAPGGGHSTADALVVGGRPFQPVRAVQRVRINGVKFTVFRDAYADATGVLDLLATTHTGSTVVRLTFREHDNGKVDREILDSMHLT